MPEKDDYVQSEGFDLSQKRVVLLVKLFKGRRLPYRDIVQALRDDPASKELGGEVRIMAVGVLMNCVDPGESDTDGWYSVNPKNCHRDCTFFFGCPAKGIFKKYWQK